MIWTPTLDFRFKIKGKAKTKVLQQRWVNSEGGQEWKDVPTVK